MSQTSLSLLVALIAALTALGAVLSNLHPARSETRVFFQAIADGDASASTEEERKLWLEVDNFGNRPSRIRGVQLILHGDRDVTLPVKKLLELRVGSRGNGEIL